MHTILFPGGGSGDNGHWHRAGGGRCAGGGIDRIGGGARRTRGTTDQTFDPIETWGTESSIC